MVDVAGILYGMPSPVFTAFAVDAVLSAGAVTATIRVIDDTRHTARVEGGAMVQTMTPGAYARMVELAALGLTPDECRDGLLTFNGRTWRINSFEPRGSPQGEDAGEVRFILTAEP